VADHLDWRRFDDAVEFYIPSALKCDVGGYRMIGLGEIVCLQSQDGADQSVWWHGQVLCFAHMPSKE